MTRKQATCILISSKPIFDPQGRQGMIQQEFNKVFPIDTTLEEILQYAVGKHTNKVSITFESEEPEERRPHSREKRQETEDEQRPEEGDGERRDTSLNIVEGTGGSPEEGPDREGSH